MNTALLLKVAGVLVLVGGAAAAYFLLYKPCPPGDPEEQSFQSQMMAYAEALKQDRAALERVAQALEKSSFAQWPKDVARTAALAHIRALLAPPPAQQPPPPCPEGPQLNFFQEHYLYFLIATGGLNVVLFATLIYFVFAKH